MPTNQDSIEEWVRQACQFAKKQMIVFYTPGQDRKPWRILSYDFEAAGLEPPISRDALEWREELKPDLFVIKDAKEPSDFRDTMDALILKTANAGVPILFYTDRREADLKQFQDAAGINIVIKPTADLENPDMYGKPVLQVQEILWNQRFSTKRLDLEAYHRERMNVAGPAVHIQKADCNTGLTIWGEGAPELYTRMKEKFQGVSFSPVADNTLGQPSFHVYLENLVRFKQTLAFGMVERMLLAVQDSLTGIGTLSVETLQQSAERNPTNAIRIIGIAMRKGWFYSDRANNAQWHWRLKQEGQEMFREAGIDFVDLPGDRNLGAIVSKRSLGEATETTIHRVDHLLAEIALEAARDKTAFLHSR